MSHPYQDLPAQAFWKSAIAQPGPMAVQGLWQPRFAIRPGAAVATYGSCFAQHIGQALRQRGFRWLDAEPAPPGCPADLAQQYHYGLFSARTGNIYTTSLLRQWLDWASGQASPPDEVWQDAAGRVFDPFRPAIEPGGFASVEEMRASRSHALACFRASIEQARCFIFTLGLTESWFHASGGYEYPMCPGTVAGEFQASEHRFVNQRHDQVQAALLAAIQRLRQINPEIRVLLTVSPVPLTATASGQHVLLATMHSKSILRAVASSVTERLRVVDYFPSYELINSPCFGGRFFEANLRQVSPEGVQFVMQTFFAGLEAAGVVLPSDPGLPARVVSADRLAASPNKADEPADYGDEGRKADREEGREEYCEEALLAAFGKPA